MFYSIDICSFLCCRTALMLASESKAVPVVEVLVHRGADLSAVDSQGHDVGHYAKLSGSSEVIAALTAGLNRHVSGESDANADNHKMCGLVASSGEGGDGNHLSSASLFQADPTVAM